MREIIKTNKVNKIKNYYYKKVSHFFIKWKYIFNSIHGKEDYFNF